MPGFQRKIPRQDNSRETRPKKINRLSSRVRQGGFGKGNKEFKITITNMKEFKITITNMLRVQMEEALHEPPTAGDVSRETETP